MKISGKFICTNCDKKYSSTRALKRHIKYDCGKEPSFVCDFCDYRSYQKVCLKGHLIKHHNVII